MNTQRCLRLGCATLFATLIIGGFSGRAASAQSFSTEAAHAAAGASPELVGALSKDVTKSDGANVGNLLASVLK
jgi:hypothetical protein